MGMQSQTNEQPGEQAMLVLGFGPDPPAADAALVAQADLTDVAESTDEGSVAQAVGEDPLEEDFESDPSLVPAGASALLVAPAVLDPREIEALLSGLHSLLEET